MEDKNASYWYEKVDRSEVGLTVQDMMKLRGEIVTAKPNFPCKMCEKDALFMVPGQGMFCQPHLPADVVILPFAK